MEYQDNCAITVAKAYGSYRRSGGAFWMNSSDTTIANRLVNQIVIAPQAPLEESATTEASRRCPLTGFLREFQVLFVDFCEWYLRFGCPKHDPGAAQDRPRSV